MKLKSVVPLTLALGALGACIAACSSDATNSPSSGAGAAGSGAGASPIAGAAGQVTSAGAPAVGGAGASSSGAAGASLGGASAGGSSAGSGGTAGSGGSGGSSGAMATGGAGGASFWGPGGPKKQWSCPAGPFPAQVKGAATDICAGFQYNYAYNEGPTWIASENAFFFSNFKQGNNIGGDIIKYTIGGACEVWLHDVGCNGLGVSPSGNLLAACQTPRAVMEYDMTTKMGRKVASMANGKMLDSPNDLIARSDGNVYFSNTTYELGTGVQGLGPALVRIDPLGMVSVVETGGLNGMALSPDEKTLYVVGKGQYKVDDAGVPTKLNSNDPGGDGIAMDCAGNISITGTNSAYGGPDGKTLIAVGGGTAAKTYPMTVPGLP